MEKDAIDFGYQGHSLKKISSDGEDESIRQKLKRVDDSGRRRLNNAPDSSEVSTSVGGPDSSPKGLPDPSEVSSTLHTQCTS